ncbi:MAG: hypothetical protein R3C28_05765 [Pirellulaceae bacterium]
MIGPGQALTVTSFDPADDTLAAEFIAALGGTSSHLLGPFSGTLDNGGENLELEKPFNVNDDSSGFVLVDRVRYDDDSPWPAAADGTGSSLQRNSAVSFGNAASSWQAAAATPTLAGAGNLIGDLNQDGVVNLVDIDLICAAIQIQDATADLNQDGSVNVADQTYLVEQVLRTSVGDVNLDGKFNSTDLVRIFQAGEYEDGVVGNSRPGPKATGIAMVNSIPVIWCWPSKVAGILPKHNVLD